MTWVDGFRSSILKHSYATRAEWMQHVEREDRLAETYRTGDARHSKLSSVQNKVEIAKAYPDKAGLLLHWLGGGTPMTTDPDVLAAMAHIRKFIGD